MSGSQTECPLTGAALLAAGPELDHARQVRAAHGKQTPDPAVRSSIRAGIEHRKDHTPSRETAERMAKAYRAALIPRRPAGAKAYEKTVRAAETYRAGVAKLAQEGKLEWDAVHALWRDIRRQVIPGYDALPSHEQQFQAEALRRNVKGYLKRRGIKLPRPVRSRHK